MLAKIQNILHIQTINSKHMTFFFVHHPKTPVRHSQHYVRKKVIFPYLLFSPFPLTLLPTTTKKRPLQG
jgi:hypothetical protein